MSFPLFTLSPLIAAVLGLVVVLSLVIAVVVRRIHVAGPNEAFIITGRKSTGAAMGGKADLSGQKVVMGASVFVLPFVQQLNVIDLSSRRLSVSIRGAVSAQGVKVDLEGVAIVKVGGNEDLIRAAAQRFLNQQNEIETFTQEVLAGSLRSIVGGLTVEEIIRDRAAFAAKVAEESEVSLTGQGLVLDTFQIQDVRTEGSYLDDLGRPEQARVKQEAASPKPGPVRRPNGSGCWPRRRSRWRNATSSSNGPRSRWRPTPPAPAPRRPVRWPQPSVTRWCSRSRRRWRSARRR
jgi:flotillin